MGSKLIILTIIITTLYRIDSETIQNIEEIPILESSNDLPEIQSPYLFSTKEMNLDAIGNNLNPQLISSQKRIETNTKTKEQMQQFPKKQSSQKKNQQNKSYQVKNQQNRQKIDNSNVNLSLSKSREQQLTEKQQVKAEKTQFQKIDLKKLMQEIEKNQKTNKIYKRKQSQITYESLFGPIQNQQNENKKSTQKVIQKVSNSQIQKIDRNKGQFKDISIDKYQIQFRQTQRNQKQLNFQPNTPTTNQKQLNLPLLDKQKVINSKKSNKQQVDQVKQAENNLFDQKQDYKQKYRKIQEQLQQLKHKHRLQEQKLSSNAEESINKDNHQSQYIFCMNIKTIVIVTTTVLLLAVYILQKKRKSSRIEDRYSLQDDQKIPSEDTD